MWIGIEMILWLCNDFVWRCECGQMDASMIVLLKSMGSTDYVVAY